LKGRERMGSSLPPAELAKMKCIFFSTTPVGRFEKSRECFSPNAAPDAEPLSLRVRCAVVLGSARVKHRTLNTRRRATPVHASGAISLLRVNLTESTGCFVCIRWCESGALSVLQNSLGKGPNALSDCGGKSPVPYSFAELSTYKSIEDQTSPVWTHYESSAGAIGRLTLAETVWISNGRNVQGTGRVCFNMKSVRWPQFLPSERANGSICLRGL